MDPRLKVSYQEYTDWGSVLLTLNAYETLLTQPADKRVSADKGDEKGTLTALELQQDAGFKTRIQQRL